MSQRSFTSSSTYTIVFMVILSFVCALILSILASALATPKEEAKELDRSKQMMIAAKILSPDGYFLLSNGNGEYLPAKYVDQGVLEPTEQLIFPTNEQILEVYKLRLKPFLVDSKGERKTFEEAKINFNDYLVANRKLGYYIQPEKLIYEILPNPTTKADQKSTDQKNKEKDSVTNAEGYVIPINGFGLWDAIYGYLAIKPDGNTIIGITWYDQKETPGLGGNIAETPWQNLFPGKHIFQESANGKTDFKTAPIGITVVRGKVSEVLGNSPKALSAVDGMAGATLTGNGVTKAYQDVLAAYRPFLIKLHEMNVKSGKQDEKKGS